MGLGRLNPGCDTCGCDGNGCPPGVTPPIIEGPFQETFPQHYLWWRYSWEGTNGGTLKHYVNGVLFSTQSVSNTGFILLGPNAGDHLFVINNGCDDEAMALCSVTPIPTPANSCEILVCPSITVGCVRSEDMNYIVPYTTGSITITGYTGALAVFNGVYPFGSSVNTGFSLGAIGVYTQNSFNLRLNVGCQNISAIVESVHTRPGFPTVTYTLARGRFYQYDSLRYIRINQFSCISCRQFIGPERLISCSSGEQTTNITSILPSLPSPEPSPNAHDGTIVVG